MIEMTYAEALALGLTECLDKDPRVVLINAGFGGLTPHRNSYAVLRQKYADRITDAPIAELGYCGIAIGAAMTGLRPIVALSTAAFSFEAWPQIVNEAAVACYGSAGQVTAPVVFHMLTGIRGAGAVQHSHAPQAMFCNAPGLQVVTPGTPADARGLMRTAALASNNPTIFIDYARLQGVKGEVILAGQYKDAAASAENALRQHPNDQILLRMAAASHALAGQITDAQNALARVRHLNPALRLSKIAELAPCRRLEDVAKYVEGMRKAGLPE